MDGLLLEQLPRTFTLVSLTTSIKDNFDSRETCSEKRGEPK